MQKTIISLAFIFAAGAQAFAQTPGAADIASAAKLIQATGKKTLKRDEVCMIAAGVSKAAWIYKEGKQVFPFEQMNSNSPFFPLYLWAFQFGTHKAANRPEAFDGGMTMCMHNANSTYRAWEAGRPLEVADLKCPDTFSVCR
ncbi:hypothetical protein LP414_27485 [Polaromonas sp. P1(28)-13]|nr:hypothetical protein LP414_27485 [Polaromonas sp. P1(28)-13]